MTPLEEVEPGDEDRVFYKQPAGRKTVVLAAGSTVHFLIAITLVFGTVLALGVPDTKAPVLLKPQPCLALSITASQKTFPKTTPDKTGACPAGTVAGVAAAAGLKAGDRILQAGGKPVATYLDFTKAVRASAGTPLQVVVKRDGARRTLTLTPALTSRPDLVDKKKTVQVGAIGVGQNSALLRHVGPVASVKATGTELGLIVTGTWDSLTKKLGTLSRVYDKNRDPAGFVGVVGVSRVSGEVFNAPIPFRTRLAGFLLIIAGAEPVRRRLQPAAAAAAGRRAHRGRLLRVGARQDQARPRLRR